jgi:trypsin
VLDGEDLHVAPLRRRPAVLVALAVAMLLPLLSVGSADAVVGGTQVPEGQHRYMASLQVGTSHICGGTVVARRWVLTAAHCVEGSKPRDFTVVVGSVDHAKGRRIAVNRIRISPRYDAARGSYDVALLKLASRAGVRAATLAKPRQSALWAHGRPVTAAGWGSQVPVAGMVPPTDSRMRQVALQVIGDDRCADATAPEVQVCAAALLRDSCHGDSGGPLLARSGQKQVQVGIVSYGLGCAVPGFAGVYTEVGAPPVRRWIRRVSGV